MKMSAPTLARLETAIVALDTAERRAQYRAGEFLNAAKVTDLNKRYRWDLLYAARLTTFVCDLYDVEGLNDANIDTALRAIVPPL